MSDNFQTPFDALIQEISAVQESILKANKLSSQLSESFSDEISSEENEIQTKVTIPSPFDDQSESNDSDRYEPCQWFAKSLSHEEEDTDESDSILTLSQEEDTDESQSILTLSSSDNLSKAEEAESESDQNHDKPSKLIPHLDIVAQFKNLTFTPSLSRSNSFELDSEEENPVQSPLKSKIKFRE